MADRHVRRSGDDYAYALLNLLPHGQAWPRDVDSTLVQALTGVADYWGFVDGRAADLLEIESDPRATIELLPDWERNWGLPDPCITDPPNSLEERRLRLIIKMTLLGGQSRAFFIHIAQMLGYEIVIQEYAPYMTGVSRCGDTRDVYIGDGLGGKDPFYRWQLGPPEMRFFWTIHVNALKLIYFRCNSSRTGIDRLLAILVAPDLECVFDKIAPAHTKIIYDYSPLEALDYTQPYNTQYLPMGLP
jgi:uncharacterized protein YmfQ (DUF2313 family)